MTDHFSLAGRLIVLTGGAGQLGQQWRAGLDGAGAQVVTIDPASDAPDAFRVDVTDKVALDWARRLLQVPDGLVCAAAIDAKPGTPGCGPFEDVPLADWERTVKVNLTGVMLSCQVFGSAMAMAGRGSIVLVSSIYGMRAPDHRRYEGMPGPPFFKPAAYGATKAALLNLTKYLACYWAPKGVRVNAITYGSMRREDYEPSFAAAFTRDVPMGRFAQPGEFDGPLQFLLSDASSYMTGANLVVDGGYTSL